ncbi:MAG: ankyrin repeat domain-containing protein [Candidatus Babeliales bacterium]
MYAKLLILLAMTNNCMLSMSRDLINAVKANKIARVEQLLLSDVDVNQDDHHETALGLAASQNKIAIAQLLLSHNRYNIDSTNKITINKPSRGLTPLHWAVYFRHEQMVQLLLNHGADVAYECEVGNALMFFLKGKHPTTEKQYQDTKKIFSLLIATLHQQKPHVLNDSNVQQELTGVINHYIPYWLDSWKFLHPHETIVTNEYPEFKYNVLQAIHYATCRDIIAENLASESFKKLIQDKSHLNRMFPAQLQSNVLDRLILQELTGKRMIAYKE